MTIRTSSLGGGSGGGFKLAPDLTYPSDISPSNGSRKSVTFNPSGGLTTALSLTGKFAVSLLTLDLLLSEAFTVKLTIDGVVIWNDSFTATTADCSLLGSISTASVPDLTVVCNSSFLLEVQSTTDTSVRLSYVARPIL